MHYATLRGHKFDEGADDIRGATVYGIGEQQLAKIDDVVFEHGSGKIKYLVANEGHGRRVLVPVDHVRASIVNDRDFDSDFTIEDIDHLPVFDDEMLRHTNQWKNYVQLHREALKERNQAAAREYAEGLADGPTVRTSSNAKVTPIDRRRRSDYVPDVTPQRMASVLTNTAQTPDKLYMVPIAGHSRGPAAEHRTADLGVRFSRYQERIRRDLSRMQEGCEECRRDKKHRVA